MGCRCACVKQRQHASFLQWYSACTANTVCVRLCDLEGASELSPHAPVHANAGSCLQVSVRYYMKKHLE